MSDKMEKLTDLQYTELNKCASKLYKPIRFNYEITMYDLVLKVQISTSDFGAEDGTVVEVLSCKSLSNNKKLNKLIKDSDLVDDINHLCTSFGDKVYKDIKRSPQYKSHDKQINAFLKKLETLNQDVSDW